MFDDYKSDSTTKKYQAQNQCNDKCNTARYCTHIKLCKFVKKKQLITDVLTEESSLMQSVNRRR